MRLWDWYSVIATSSQLSSCFLRPWSPGKITIQCIPRSPITGYQGEETSTLFSTSPLWEAGESHEVIPSVLQTRQAQSSQLLLTGHSFQPFHQLLFMPSSGCSKWPSHPEAVGPRTAHSAQGEAAPSVSTEGQPPLLPSWSCHISCTAGYGLMPGLPGLTAEYLQELN